MGSWADPVVHSPGVELGHGWADSIPTFRWKIHPSVFAIGAKTCWRALQEYGRLNKTIFILRYLLDEPFQRRIGAQINKGEVLHALRGFLFVANEGKIRHHYDEEQLNQVSCLNLVTNAVVLWNADYMSAVLDQLRSEGHNVDDGDVVHLSLRPLRLPDSAAAYVVFCPYGMCIVMERIVFMVRVSAWPSSCFGEERSDFFP
jgi:hypothetical protein